MVYRPRVWLGVGGGMLVVGRVGVVGDTLLSSMLRVHATPPGRGGGAGVLFLIRLFLRNCPRCYSSSSWHLRELSHVGVRSLPDFGRSAGKASTGCNNVR